MESKKIVLSNFVIPNFIIKSICRDNGIYPFEINIEMGKSTFVSNNSLKFTINNNLTRKQKNLSILNLYLSSFKQLHSSELAQEVIPNSLAACSFLCDIYFTNNKISLDDNKARSSHFPLFYSLTKNIIFPYYNINHKYLNDFDIFFSGSECYDFNTSEDCPSVGITEIREEYRDLFIFKCADSILEKNLEKNSCFIKNFINNNEVMRMVYPVLSSYYLNDNYSIDAFLGMMQIFSDSTVARTWVEERSSLQKTARYNLDGNFWIYGLIEKMLSPARGSDFTIKQKWAPIANQFWQEMESARKQSGLSGASLEFMLRVKDPEVKEKPEIIQKLIEETRS